ncbi:CPBP family intramembrane metalloprotease [candidate division WOR-3 bacterium]|uniref:CPBP family intramembrane metalloprotease n=1 Tax=candidate division WOR-3 bacterium TaxID=2052148 RepID=A0A9D5KAM9_UNCW3|nr:CPBP family intramembrane metalloprotease [candidate division WOR-3 bacterium]MBD3365244.1 CPBP family intramembrane metalloprotease [candidate division WOR-3 bacterium]
MKPPGHPLYTRPFNDTVMWTSIFLIVIFVLRFGHLLRGIPGTILVLSSQILSLLIALFLVRRKSKREAGFTGFKPWWLAVVIPSGFLIGLALAAFNHLILPSADWIVAMDRSLLPGEFSDLPFWSTEVVIAFAGGVLTPLAEEFFFRGVLMTGWRRRLNVWLVLVIQALIFGFLHLAHVGVELFPVFSVDFGLAANILAATTMGGFLFGLVRLKSGSIWPAVPAHAAVNLGAAVVFTG